MQINVDNWKVFLIKDLFDVVYGVNLELANCVKTHKDDKEGIAFVSRAESNNGVVAYVKPIPGIIPQEANTITVAAGGSTLATFLQTQKFYSGRDLYLLYSKENISNNAKLFIITLIKANKYRYSYGRQANLTLPLLKIRLPINSKGRPDWEYMDKYISSLIHLPKTYNISCNLALQTDKWQYFKLKDLFTIEHGKVSDTSVLEKGDDVYYIGAKKTDNGIICKCKSNSQLISKGNCLVFICDGQGSIGYNNYMPYDFMGTVNLSLGYSKHLNQYIGLFLVTILDQERFRFSFGRKRKSTLSETMIKLPATADNTPDWQFMEEYIKSLPYGDCL